MTQTHRVNLVANLDGSNFEVQERLNQLQKGFMAKGYSINESLKKAYEVLDFSVIKQSTVLAYMDIFLYLGLLFLCCIPFILLIKKGNNKINPADAMH